MKKVISILGVFLLLTACSKSKTEPDGQDSLLPEYSEEGRNVAGALVNDTAWRAQMLFCTGCGNTAPFDIITSTSGDSTVFLFAGEYTPNSVNYVDTSADNLSMDFRFMVKGLKMEKQEDLLKLNNQTFLLNGVDSYVSLAGANHIPRGKGTGTFIVKNVSLDNSFVAGDGSPGNPIRYRYIVSGYFNFTVTVNNKVYSIQEGRYDMAVMLEDNFFITQ